MACSQNRHRHHPSSVHAYLGPDRTEGKKPTWKNTLIAGAALGTALLLKFSTFLLIPYLLILAVVFALARHEKITSVFRWLARVTLIVTIGFVFVVWPVYYFHTVGQSPQKQRHDTEYLLQWQNNKKLANVVIWMSDKPVIRALDRYGLGLLMTAQRATGGNTTYFFGKVSAAGWKY